MVYPVRLEATGVVLRELAPDDLDASLRVVGDPSVTALLGYSPRTRAEQAELLAADITRARWQPRPDYLLAVTPKPTDTMIGLVWLGLAPAGYGEIGCALRGDQWRRGHGTDASAALLDFAFDRLGLRRVQAACAIDHPAGRTALDRLGFTYEGRMRECLRVGDGWRDSALYSMLAPEWAGLRAGAVSVRTAGHPNTDREFSG
jgi:ribosomal-protein-alanine N-acetyltransferase